MLPFEESKKKYQCFVCGEMIEDFEDFKKHIVDLHEEGRDYILCPVTHCGAPVRDMKMHFKVKHPSIQMPKKGMLKAIVWRDFGPKGKKTQKPKFRQGFHTSTKMNKEFQYRSKWEKTVFECLDQHAEIVSYEVEPFAVPYIHKGKSHKYYPDIVLKYISGDVEVWEIKPANQTALEINQDKWYYAEKACEMRGWKFCVISEQDITDLKKQIKEQLNE